MNKQKMRKIEKTCQKENCKEEVKNLETVQHLTEALKVYYTLKQSEHKFSHFSRISHLTVIEIPVHGIPIWATLHMYLKLHSISFLNQNFFQKICIKFKKIEINIPEIYTEFIINVSYQKCCKSSS